MSNPARGEVDIVIDGRTYIGKLTMGACCALQREWDMVPPAEILRLAGTGSLLHLESVLFHAIRAFHPVFTRADLEAGFDKHGWQYFAGPYVELCRSSVVAFKADEAPAEGNAPTPTPEMAAA